MPAGGFLNVINCFSLFISVLSFRSGSRESGDNDGGWCCDDWVVLWWLYWGVLVTCCCLMLIYSDISFNYHQMDESKVTQDELDFFIKVCKGLKNNKKMVAKILYLFEKKSIFVYI